MKKVGIIGRTNVGKSTLFNRLVKQDKSIVSNVAGTTRDFISGQVDCSGKKFELIDFGGLDFAPQNKIDEEVNKVILREINSLDLILFVVDGKCAISEKDEKITELIRKTRRETILVVNKLDSAKQQENIYDFFQLGFEKTIGISAAENSNTDLLVKLILSSLNISGEKELSREDITKIAIVGRPNVGKSTLFNVLCKQERSIVTEIAGTTRDAVDSEVEINNKKYLFIDTAGLRRRTKISYLLDKFSASKSLAAINKADIILYLIGFDSYIVAYDINLLGYAWRKGKSIICVVNKWDMRTGDMNEKKYQQLLIRDNNFFKNFSFVFVSASKKTGMEKIANEIKRIENLCNFRIPTPVLNKEMKIIFSKLAGWGKAKFFYATQIKERPIEILLFVNNSKLFKKKQLDFLEKNIRERFELNGIPIILRTRERSREN